MWRLLRTYFIHMVNECPMGQQSREKSDSVQANCGEGFSFEPKGPQGQKRPADVIGNTVDVARIVVGEIEETTYTQPNKAKSGCGGA